MKLITSIATLALLLQAPLLSAQSPTLVRDFWPGEVTATILNHGGPNSFRIHNDRLLLSASDGPTLGKIFALDDLSGTVEELAHVGGVVGYTTTNGGIVTSGDNIYFYTQVGLNWVLYGVQNGGVVALATLPLEFVFYHAMIPLPNGRILFSGHDETHGWEPWVSDGTVAGTQMVKDISAGSSTSLGSPFPLFQGFDFGGKAYFLAGDGSNGIQLWSSDGTSAGTTQFAAINDPGETGAITLEWSKNDDRFMVSSTQGILASDGTTTELMHPATMQKVYIPGLNYTVSPEGWMYFIAMENPWRFYRTKGTAATTEAVLNAAEPQIYTFMAEMNGMLYAFATPSGGNTELRRLDPVAGTVSTVKVFSPITNGSGSNTNFFGFRVLGNHIYFCAIEGDSHRQYWRSDGTTAGTGMISNFQPSPVNGGPNPSSNNMIPFAGHFVFTANSEVVGVELFAAQGVVGISEIEAANSTIHAWMDGSGSLVLQGTEQLGNVRVLDGTGREVARKDNVRGEQVRIALGQQSAGLYLIRSEYQGQVRHTKVVLD